MKKTIFVIILLLLTVRMTSALGYSSVTYPTPTVSYSSGDASTYWPILEGGSDKVCSGRQDLLLSIAPAGCQPTVVTSDLLAEQNVPVFCQVQAMQINPLLDIKAIDSMTFSGKYSSEVVGTGFHPAQAAIYSGTQILGNPTLNNIGYIVVVLKREANESALPESVQLNLTAQIDYNSYNALGVGNAYFVVPVMNDNQWAANVSAKEAQSFWQGRYFVRVESADSNEAVVSIYYGDQKISTTRVLQGKTSNDIYIPGFSSCEAALQIQYNGFQSSEDRAILEVTDERGTDVVTAYGGSGLTSSGTNFYNGKCYASNVVISGNDTYHGSVDVTCNGQKFSLVLQPKGTSAPSASSSSTSPIQNSQYYSLALANYTDVAAKYSSEEYAQAALEKAVALAQDAGDSTREISLINLYLNAYPTGNLAANYKNILDIIQKTDFKESVGTAVIDNRVVTISLKKFEKGSMEKSVYVQVAGKALRDSKGEYVKFGETVGSGISNSDIPLGDNKAGTVKVSRIDADSAYFVANCNNQGTNTNNNINNNANSLSGSFTLKEGESARPCGISFTLQQVNAEKLAAIQIVPNVHNTQTTTNLSFQIGIEKRAIQLSPDKTKQMISSLNASIAKWESISKNLEHVVTGMKAACFATAAALTVKNLVAGFDGTAQARKDTMDGDKGWTKRCQDAFTHKTDANEPTKTKQYASVSDCLNQNSQLIDKQVEVSAGIIQTINKEREAGDASSNAVTKSSMFGDIIDTKLSATAAISSLQSSIPNQNIDVNGQSVNLQTFAGGMQDAFNKGAISYSQINDFELNSRLLTAHVNTASDEEATNVLSSIITNVNANVKYYDDTQAASKTSKSDRKLLIQDENARTYAYYGGKYPQVYSSLVGAIAIDTSNPGQSVQEITYHGQDYALILTEHADISGTKTYTVSKIYQIGSNGKDTTDVTGQASLVPPASIPGQQGVNSVMAIKSMNFQLVDSASCSNPYDKPEVKYFETAPNKGLPAIVPVDTVNGWYAATEQSSISLGGQTSSSYQSSGRVVSFWLCNVGLNHVVDFDNSGRGDDNCQQFNLNTGQATAQFACMSDSATKALVNKAISRINQAAQQYASGLQAALFTDNGGSKESIKVGLPSSGTTSAQCESYMSPSDCHILFNICDPVICPTSRCNLGGQYSVSDVPSTGIIGSTLLCLPNIREGIYVPVCLTGIESGIDGFISLLKNHRDCLQENLDTGQTIGICDEIYSVYACEFFWNQVAPVAKIWLPKLVEAAYGQGSKGGGEYLTIASAWQNTQSAMNYFTQQYGVNSLKAFQARSAEEYGSMFCKAFISTNAPSNIGTLIQPDSPPQFNAWFSSTKYSDVTVPATSQYKVFYHIYSGKDSGVYYEVYLKDPTGSSYYSTAQTVTVASGFVSKGEYASETKDFTAPEGYQQLCVKINNDEQCGFKQVSTSFAVNYLADSITSSEGTASGITTELGCTSGDPSLAAMTGGLMTGGVQGAAESSANPQIYNQGIIRICATQNPGLSTDPTRYSDVGYCGDAKTRCWLDSKSVINAIGTNSALLNSTTASLQQLQTANSQLLNSQGYISDSNAAKTQLDNIASQIPYGTSMTLTDIQTITSEISALQTKLYYNANRAYALYLLGLVSDNAARAGLVSGAITTSTAPSVPSSQSSLQIVWKKVPAPTSMINPLLGGSAYQIYINSVPSLIFVGGNSVYDMPPAGSAFTIYLQTANSFQIAGYVSSAPVSTIALKTEADSAFTNAGLPAGVASALQNSKLVIS
jgi:hypothetical protein